MAQWIGAQGQVKVAKNTPTYGVPPKKTHWNENFLFPTSTTRFWNP